MKLFFSIMIACSVALAVSAQKTVKEPSPTPTPERPREIVALLNDARLAAPELAVDTVLRVLESKKIKDVQWRRELLEEAMRMADDVKYPIRRERAYYGTGIVDTVSGYMTYAYNEKLDTLSLKARIIKDWLAEDKTRARQIVYQMGGDLKLKPLTCDDAMGYLVDDIYASVAAVAKDSFTPTEISDGVRGLFLLPWIENMQSPTQILPIMEMLSGLKGPAPEHQLLINALERAVNRSFGDDLSFSHAFFRASYKASQFINSAREREELTMAWRDFLAKNSSGPRCLESKPKNKDDLPHPVAEFNFMFPEEKRFTVEDFVAVEYRGAPKDKLYLDSEMYKKVSLLFKAARETKNRPENKDDKSAQLEWQTKISDVLQALDSWKASAEETESEVFNPKTVFYGSMIPEVADPEMKAAVMRAFMRYLAGSPMQKDSFIEWFYYTRWLTGKDPAMFDELAPDFPNPNFKVMRATKKLGL